MLWITSLYWSPRRTLLHYVWRKQALRCLTKRAAYVCFWPEGGICQSLGLGSRYPILDLRTLIGGNEGEFPTQRGI